MDTANAGRLPVLYTVYGEYVRTSPLGGCGAGCLQLPIQVGSLSLLALGLAIQVGDATLGVAQLALRLSPGIEGGEGDRGG